MTQQLRKMMNRSPSKNAYFKNKTATIVLKQQKDKIIWRSLISTQSMTTKHCYRQYKECRDNDIVTDNIKNAEIMTLLQTI